MLNCLYPENLIDANVPSEDWPRKPYAVPFDAIHNSSFLKNFIDDPAGQNIYLFSDEILWNREVLSRVVVSLMFRMHKCYCIDANSFSSVLKSTDTPEFPTPDRLQRYDILAIYHFGDESVGSFNENINFLMQVVENRNHRGRSTIFCSRYQLEEIVGLDRYRRGFLEKIFYNPNMNYVAIK